MHVSPQGLDALELEEGVVLKAYRDAVGVWTIGAGLTAASGVIKPKGGMVISRGEASELLQRALQANYEPAVEMAMTRTDKAPVERPLQHEFDAAVSFHFNTGAIRKATWVKLWKAKAGRAMIRAGLAKWNRGGGKVLPGLTDRRNREAAMLLDAVYRVMPAPQLARATYADWGMILSSTEKAAVRDALAALGYRPGDKLDAILRLAINHFQHDHDLTVDGIIGRATLSTIQRELDARKKVKAPAVAAVASVPVASTDYADQIANLPHLGTLLAVAAVIWLMTNAYRYRDVIAAQIHSFLPRVAAFLRSF